MIIKIKPIDTLFFGMSKPFITGQKNKVWAESLLVPNYSTIYGALRTAYLVEHPEELDKMNTDEDPTSGFQIKNVYYCIDEDIFIPAPADLVIDKEDERKKQHEINKDQIDTPYTGIPLKIVVADGFLNSLQKYYGFTYQLMAPSDIQVESLSNACIQYCESSLNDYTNEKKTALINLAQQIIHQPKAGIKLKDSVRCVEESMFYNSEELYYDKLQILVDFEDVNHPDEDPISRTGVLKLGSAHPVKYISCNDEELGWDYTGTEKAYSVLKLCLQAPAIFKNGWLPDFIDPDSLEGTLEIEGVAHQVKLLTACVSGYMNIGGFDIKRKEEKNFYRAVKPGAVYWLQVLDGSVVFDAIIKKVMLQTELSKEGYGAALLFGGNAE